jgi:leucyl aminopeptidase
MGGIIGVARGSSERPRFIVAEYLAGRKKERPIVLVGKGVTFDTGGLNLKPEQGMGEMHMDMSGGAAVIHIISALARLKIKKNIVGLVPAVENMPSGSSYHPGDMLKTMSGKTIEVLNTDAEGRIILADALAYAQKFYSPRLVIDIATLTGAAISALGQRASAIFTNTPRLENILRETSEQTGDFVWPLPLWEEYEEEIKGTFGDVANIGKTRNGGAITAAVFLWQFIKEAPNHSDKKPTPWVHLDIAPRMTTIDGEYLSKGAAGASINLLTQFLSKF